MADSRVFLRNDNGGIGLARSDKLKPLRAFFLFLVLFASTGVFADSTVYYIRVTYAGSEEYLPAHSSPDVQTQLVMLYGSESFEKLCPDPGGGIKATGHWLYQDKALRFICNSHNGRQVAGASPIVKMCLPGQVLTATGCSNFEGNCRESATGAIPTKPQEARCDDDSCVYISKSDGAFTGLFNIGVTCKPRTFDGIDCAEVAQRLGGGLVWSYKFDYPHAQPACGFSACKEGEHIVGNACISDPAECPSGQTRVDGVCKPIDDGGSGACPSGQTRVNGVCKPVDTGGGGGNECPSGQTRVNGVCKPNDDGGGGGGDDPCPQGFHRENGQCVPDEDDGGGGGDKPCPQGQKRDSNGVCKPDNGGGGGGDSPCKEDEHKENGICKPGYCPKDQHIEDGKCVTGECPEGQHNENGLCVPGSGECTNGATNYPKCDNGDGGGGEKCSNGATNYPICDDGGDGGGVCTNGSTNYPKCDNGGGGGKCSNGSTNYPKCDNGGNGGGNPNGSLIDKWNSERKIRDAVADMGTDLANTNFVRGARGVVNLSVSGSCPAWNFSEPYILKVNIDMSPYFCGQLASGILAAIGIAVLVGAVWSAWWILFVL